MLSSIRDRVDVATGKSAEGAAGLPSGVAKVLKNNILEHADSSNARLTEFDSTDAEARRALTVQGFHTSGHGASGFEYQGINHYPLPSGLGEDADRIIAYSPSLSRRLYQVQRLDWRIGSDPSYLNTVDHEAKMILVNGSLPIPEQVGEMANLIGRVHPDNKEMWRIKPPAELPESKREREVWAGIHAQRNLRGFAQNQLEREQARTEILAVSKNEIDIYVNSGKAAVAFREYLEYSDWDRALQNAYEVDGIWYRYALI